MLWMLLSSALAADKEGPRWKDQAIERRGQTDFTAYTVGQSKVRLGLVNQEVGVLDNASIGAVLPLYVPPLSVPNIQGKVTAIQTRNVDVSIDGAYFTRTFDTLGLEGVSARVTPVGWTASWTPHLRWGIHFGQTYTMASIKGELAATDIAEALTPVIGIDISKDLDKAGLGGSGLYGGANLTLLKQRFAVEYRMNRRDSLVLISNTYLRVSGLLAGGVSIGEVEGAEVDVGPSARVDFPLGQTIPTLTSLSWQWSWPRFRLRVGIPSSLFALTQAFELHWVLGKNTSRDKQLAILASEPAPE